MNIEILYPELCCLYGEKGNMMFLKQCLPEANFIETRLNDRPAFLDQNVSLCYIGSCSEQSQELLLDKLRPFKDEIHYFWLQGMPWSFSSIKLFVKTKEKSKL